MFVAMMSDLVQKKFDNKKQSSLFGYPKIYSILVPGQNEDSQSIIY